MIEEIINVSVEIVDVIDVAVEINPEGSGEGGDATVENSDQTYQETVPAGDTLVLPDQEANVYLDDALVETVSYPAMTDPEINIIWT